MSERLGHVLDEAARVHVLDALDLGVLVGGLVVAAHNRVYDVQAGYLELRLTLPASLQQNSVSL